MRAVGVAVPSFADSMRISLQEIADATGGRVEGSADPSGLLSGIETDSRRVCAGQLFVALRGERHDGHDFVVQAFARGAAAALVDGMPAVPPGGCVVRVADTLRALGDLAGWIRRSFPLRVAAVTGSNGKTTTKDLIAAICDKARFAPPRTRCLKTEGNFNNLVGLPLTLLRLCGDEAVAVVELGMNRPGEIARLTEIARPDVGVITNVGAAHLEGVGGSIAGVAAAKGELFAGMSREATIAVNIDDEAIRGLARKFPGRQVTFGANGEVRAGAIVDLGLDGIAFELHVGDESTRVRLRLLGLHNVRNALAAAAVCRALGLPISAISAGLEDAQGPPQRMQAIRLGNGVLLINDAYNANPSSMEAALEALRRLPGRPVVVLGDMWELGEEGRRAHRDIGERAASLGVRDFFLIGAQADHVAEGARAGGAPSRSVRICASRAEMAEAVAGAWRNGDCVLVKGSHGMRMNEVVDLLERAGNAR